MNYCCEEFQSHLTSNDLCLSYDPSDRSVYICGKSEGCIYVIKHCPWCGKEFDSSLENQRIDLINELGYTSEQILANDLPSKYLSDEWWKEIQNDNPDRFMKLEREHENDFLPREKSTKHYFCCEQMYRIVVVDKDIMFDYLPYVREFGIAKRNSATGMYLIHFCPWCGSRLPRSLREEWYRYVWDPKSLDMQTKIPKLFRTDQWWIENREYYDGLE